jgi:hypothetical protein
MHLTPEQLAEIELFASRGFTVREVAIILKLNITDFEILFLEENNPAFMHYNSGLLKAELSVRNSLYNSAVSGSNPAQVEMQQHFTKASNYLKQLNS